MRPLHALFLKEFRQHGGAFTVLGGMLTVSLVVLMWSASRAVRVLTALQYSGLFLLLFIPLAALVLANRLVTQEYSGRTQLFLEALPIPRAQMVTAKFVMGLACLLSMALAGLAAIVSVASFSETVGARFLAILAFKSCSFVTFVWAALFLLGFLGRFRIPIVISGLLILSALAGTKEVDFTRIGPLALINPQTYAFERTAFGWESLIETNLASLGCIALAYVVALAREGSVAEALSRRMTQREKATSGTLILLGVMGAALLEAKKLKAPFEFQSSAVEQSDTLPISILYAVPERKAVARRLLDRLERSLGSMADALGIPLPPTRIVYGYALDPQTFETADLADADGLLVRANYDDALEPQREALEAYVIRGVLALTTRGRCRFEPKRWLHDGFPVWWAARDAGDAGGALDPLLLARAVVVLRQTGKLPDALARWTALREKTGEPMAEAFAYSGVAHLERTAGRDAVVRLARSVLGRRPPADIRETFHEWAHPMPMVFAEAIGTPWDGFLAAWARWLEQAAQEPPVAAILARVPAVVGAIDVRDREGLIREIHGRFDGRPPDPGLLEDCVMLHRGISPFDREVTPESLLREETDCSEGLHPLAVVGRYAPGERVFVALEVGSTALGAPLRLAVRRLEIR